jgi:signal transduction histidine kinase
MGAELDLATEVLAILQLLWPHARSRRVSIAFAIQPGATVAVHRTALHRVLTQLVMMAIRRTPHGAILVTGRVQDRTVLLSVVDDSPMLDITPPDLDLGTMFQSLALQGCTLNFGIDAGEGIVATLLMPGSTSPQGGVVE